MKAARKRAKEVDANRRAATVVKETEQEGKGKAKIKETRAKTTEAKATEAKAKIVSFQEHQQQPERQLQPGLVLLQVENP